MALVEPEVLALVRLVRHHSVLETHLLSDHHFLLLAVVVHQRTPDPVVLAVLALVVEVARQLALAEVQQEIHSLEPQALHPPQMAMVMMEVLLLLVILVVEAAVLVEQELPLQERDQQGVMEVLVFNCIQTIAIQHPQ